MARKMANKAAVESIRKRLGLDLAPFSLAIGYGESAYGDMLRSDKIPETAGMAAECLVRRQSPGALAEVTYLTRIVRGIPQITMLDGDLREMTLDGERFLLIPKPPISTRPGSRPLIAGSAEHRALREALGSDTEHLPAPSNGAAAAAEV